MDPQFVDVGSLATLAGTVLVILIFTALFKEVLKAFGMKKPGRYAPIFAIALGVMIQVTLRRNLYFPDQSDQQIRGGSPG